MTTFLYLLEPLTPKSFDKNELYTLVIIVVVWVLFIILHKKERLLSQTEIIALYVFNVWFATVGDRMLAEPPLDFYDTLDYAHGELFDSILQVVVYPVPIIIAIHLFRKLKPNRIWFMLISASILSGLEWISETFFDVFQFKNWRTMYSFVFYFFVIRINLSYIHKIQELFMDRKRK
ncbi:hypothetical protein SAMN05216389_101306 [Oceanobacillus limi]|uniref:Uncharacterized protein n=1 Tax=Oceanobacillus limi TaxID=930131 RepID=A0A1H9YBY9_9BACI|nr:hypothetical protein [Oceanobacillus limi]SES66374.1 hypothetical protein SAMN05216389_101306 [Oceanobacillus limi]